MIKRMFYPIVMSVLAAGLVGLGLAAGLVLDDALGRYPGSVRIAHDGVDFHPLDQGAVRLQSTYQTQDEVPVVRHWYAARLRISPASDQAMIASDGCAWLTQSTLINRVSYTVSVLLCPVPAGTRVVVNESLALER